MVNDNTEEIGHSFHASGVNAQGDLFIVWLDDRGGNHIPKDGARPQARGLYYAVLPDGRPEAPLTNHLIRPHSVCDCCRPALAFEPDGDALLLTRLADGGLRDHGLFRLGREGKAAFIGMSPADKWRIEACPHHGPAMANADGRLHAVWFTGADTRQGLFYAVSTDGGHQYSTARPVGRLDRSAGHPDVAAWGRDVWLAWTERESGLSELWVEHSGDGGETWTPARRLARGKGPADYAFLHRVRDRVMVSWTTADGHRVLDASAGAAASR